MSSAIQRICVFCDLPILVNTAMRAFDDGHFCHDECYDNNTICPCQREEEEIVHQYNLISLPTQYGKTKLTIKIIKENAKKGIKSIIFTKKTNGALKQFADRVAKSGLKWLALGTGIGSKDGNCRNLTKMIKKIEKENPDCILMCAVRSRVIDDFLIIIKELKSRVSVFFDECQDAQKTFNDAIDHYKSFRKIVSVYGITATPSGVYECLGEVFIPDYTALGSDNKNYRGMESCSFFRLSTKNVIPEDMTDIIAGKHSIFLLSGYHTLVDNNILNCLVGGRRPYVFFPGKTCVSTHDSIVKMCHRINRKTVVVVVNGNGINMSFFDKDEDNEPTPLLINNKGEIASAIWEACREKGLTERPLVLTGHNCIRSSLTLCEEEKIGHFTHAVFAKGVVSMKANKEGEISHQEYAYQIVRLTGRRASDEKILVFCDEIFESAVINQEKKTKNQLNYQGESMTEEEYNAQEFRNAMGISLRKRVHVMRFIIQKEGRVWSEEEIEIMKEEYKSTETHNFDETSVCTLNEAIDQINERSVEKFKRTISKDRKRCTRDDRFYMSNIGGKKTRALPEIASTEKILGHCGKYNIGNQMRGNVYACYRDIINPDTLEIWFAYGDGI